MEVLYTQEHLRCFNFDSGEKPLIEIIQYRKETRGLLCINNNEIVFVLEGNISGTFDQYSEYKAQKGQMLFLPAGGGYSFVAQHHFLAIVLRLNNPVQLCQGFVVEKLFDLKRLNNKYGCIPQTKAVSLLDIYPRMWRFVNELYDSLFDGIRCKQFFELKTKEFFITLRSYYTKESLQDFFYMILSEDTAFSEHVRLHWTKYRTVNDLATSMNFSPKQFTAKFKDVFGTTPYQWMLEGKSRNIHRELAATEKPLKQIAIEHGFSTMAQFTKFCKAEIGAIPSHIRSSKNNMKK